MRMYTLCISRELLQVVRFRLKAFFLKVGLVYRSHFKVVWVKFSLEIPWTNEVFRSLSSEASIIKCFHKSYFIFKKMMYITIECIYDL